MNLICPIPGLTSFKWKPQNSPSSNSKISDSQSTMPFKFHTKASQLSNKPVESALSPTALPDANQDDAAHGLEALVEHSATENDVGHGIHMHGKNIFEIPWIHRMIPGIEKLATEYHIGNFVVERETGERIFESMPIYARFVSLGAAKRYTDSIAGSACICCSTVKNRRNSLATNPSSIC